MSTADRRASIWHYSVGRGPLCAFGSLGAVGSFATSCIENVTCEDCRLIANLGSDGYLAALSNDVNVRRREVDEAMANLAKAIDKLRFAVASILTDRPRLHMPPEALRDDVDA